MITILVLAVLVTATSVWWLARPGTVAIAGQGATQRLQLEAVRDRLVAQLQELDYDQADGRVDSVVAGDEHRRLEFELAQVLKELDGLGLAARGAGAPRRSPVVVVVLALFLPVAAGTLYVMQSRQWLRSITTSPAAPEAQAQIPPFVYKMVGRLEQHLRQHPDDLSGWMQLARSYLVLGHPHKADAAYEHAYRLAPRNEQVISTYALALYSADPTRTTGKVALLYDALYRLDPKRQDALWFLGLKAYNEGHLHQTLRFWNRLLRLMPAKSPAVQGVRDAIAHVQRALASKAPARKPG